jgi:hypothetical protein
MGSEVPSTRRCFEPKSELMAVEPARPGSDSATATTVPVGDAAYYEQQALWGREWEGLEPRARSRILGTAALMPHDITTVVDVGSGDGVLLHHLQGRSSHFLVAVERSWTALSSVRVAAVQASADALPLADRSVDLVSACEVIEHLPVGLFERSVRELERVAGRYVLVTVPNDEDLRRGFVVCAQCGCTFHRNRHLRSFDRSRLAGLFPPLTLVTVEEIGPLERVYPMSLLRLALRLGLVAPAPTPAPLCPQCGFAEAPRAAASLPRIPMSRRHPLVIVLRSLVTALLPVRRKRPWLAALYERTGWS